MSEPHLNRSLVQFSLRSLFVVTLVVAFVNAVSTRFLKTEDGLIRVAIGVGAYFLAVIFACWRRLRVEAAAGRIIYQCRSAAPPIANPKQFSESAPQDVRQGRSTTGTLLKISFNILVGGVYGLLLVVGTDPLFAAYAGIFFAQVTIRRWWRVDHRSLELGERGLVSLVWFLPWSEIKRFEWTGPKSNKLLIQLQGSRRYFQIDTAQRDEVDAILNERTKPPAAEPAAVG